MTPHLDKCLGALDGTHISCHVSSKDRSRFRNRKGDLSINVMAACTFDLRFCYVLAGWEGSANDSRVYWDARRRDFRIPEGHFYLADAGYPPSAKGLLVPYRKTRYHLREWERGKQK